MTFPINLPTRAHLSTPQAMLRRRASPSSRRHRPPRADPPPPSPPLASSSPTHSVRHFITLNNKPYPDVVNGFNSDEEAAGRHGVYPCSNHLSLLNHNSFFCRATFPVFCSFTYFCADLRFGHLLHIWPIGGALCLHYSAFVLPLVGSNQSSNNYDQ